MLEAASKGAITERLAEHLRTCPPCAAEWEVLEERRERLDALLPQLAQGGEPAAGFRARVLAAAEAINLQRRMRRSKVWTLTASGAAAAIVLVLTVWHRNAARKIPASELAAAQRLAEWRAPTDSLLAIPGQEILKKAPKLGELYWTVPVSEVKEE